jgi:hypothetical protein
LPSVLAYWGVSQLLVGKVIVAFEKALYKIKFSGLPHHPSKQCDLLFSVFPWGLLFD